MDRSILHFSNNRKRSSQLFVNEETEDTHHGGTSVVKLNSTLLQLGGIIEFIPSEVDVTVTEVTREFTSSSNILHDVRLQESDEEEDLEESLGRDRVGTVQRSPAVGVRVKGVALQVDSSGKVEAGTGDDVTQERQLTDTSVLHLDVSQTFEVLLIAIGNDLERIEEAEGWLCTQRVFEGIECRRGSLLLGRGEGGGRGDKRCEDCELHGQSKQKGITDGCCCCCC
mmetsp:Transcript_6076/g.15113  ORF Transcript_6076/g.15113 Transcript_6076/m.15113 type:complete len:226 (-) Transcript_6076:22-699(-)